jgi:hypothetical protein
MAADRGEQGVTVNSPPAVRPIKASAERPASKSEGEVWLRSADGEGARRISKSLAAQLISAKLVKQVADAGHVELKPDIRWIFSELTNGLPDLHELAQRQPARYAANWRGSGDPHVGKGALGRSAVDRTVFVKRPS